MKSRYLAGAAILLPQILEPEDLTIRGIDKGEMEALVVESPITESSGVSLGLTEHVLGTEAEPLRLDGCDGFSPVKEDIIGWAFGRVVFFHCRSVIGAARLITHNGRPAGRRKTLINELFPRGSLIHRRIDSHFSHHHELACRRHLPTVSFGLTVHGRSLLSFIGRFVNPEPARLDDPQSMLGVFARQPIGNPQDSYRTRI